jgi:acetylglutamate/LysW-gamma-L-alpha-aminoadipate kinase
VIHGAHLQLDRLATLLGHPPRMVTSVRGEVTRYTDRETMDQFLMAYCGLVNKRLVEGLRREGADAVGLSAMDGGIATGRRKPDLRIVEGDRRRLLHDNHAGTIEAIDASLLRLLLDTGRLPVLTPPAISDQGEAINVDGDRLAAEVAIALGAQRLLILMNVPGLLRDPADETSLIPRLGPDEIEPHLPLARGRARVKLLAARRALEGGVPAVVLGDGRGERPLARALGGSGTWIATPERLPLAT